MCVYVYITCAQACLVGWTLFPHIFDKYGVHWLHSAFLTAWIVINGNRREHKSIYRYISLSTPKIVKILNSV